MVNVLYKTAATATGAGRAGQTALEDGSATYALSVPKELGGGGGQGLNPEQLFAMGYAACYMGALRNVARRQNITLSDETRVHCDIGIGPRDDGAGYGLTAKLSVHLPEVAPLVAHALLETAHVVCPYSHALTKGLKVETHLI